jgi:hypothetical protein
MKTRRLWNILQASLGILILLLPSACSAPMLLSPERTEAKEPPTPAAASPASAAADATAAYPITLGLTITAPPPPADWAVAGDQEGASTAEDANGAGQGGLATTPAWSATGKEAGVLVGWSVSTAGDVNGDGYDDVIVGVPRYDDGQPEEGVVFLYPGGPDGPATSPAWMVKSDQAYAWFGIAVAPAGDVNGDGYDDVIVGAPRYDGEQRDEGAAFVYYGGPTGILTTTAWLTHPTDQADARFGTAVAAVGDVDGDGFADVVVTANGYDAEETNEGAAFMYRGGPDGLADAPAWEVHPTDQAYANFGRSASTAGDVNGDGYDDVIVGAPWYDTDQSEENWDKGAAFVYHGSALGLAPDADWTMMGEGQEKGKFGIAVSTAGDVNGDGYSDVIIGAYQHREVPHVTPYREGVVFVYHGDPAGLTTGAADWTAAGGQEESKFGLVVATAGDVNGDRYADVAVGAPNYEDGQPQEGTAFVYHGGLGGLDASPAWSVQGDQEGAGYGFTVATAGDVNGDGYSDLVVGAPTYNSSDIDAGGAFVYLGSGGAGGR